MSLKERLIRSIGTEGTVESSQCLGQIESKVTVLTDSGNTIEVVTADDLITGQAVPDGTRIVVVKLPGLRPRMIKIEA